MAVQVESKGQLQEFLEILGKRKWQVILPALVIMAIAVAAAVIVPKKFVARTQVEIRPVGVSISTKDSANAMYQIKAQNRILKVIRERQDPEYLSAGSEDQKLFLKRIEGNIKVTTAASVREGATFVNIDYSDVIKERAEGFLRALRDDWTEDVLSSDIHKAESEAKTLLEQRNRTARKLREEKERLAELLRLNALPVTMVNYFPERTSPEDPDFARLKADEKRRDEVRAEITVLETKLGELQRQYDEMPAKLTREELSAGQSNETELNDVERQIQDLQEQLKGVKPLNSKYKRMSQEIDALRERRDQLQRLVTKGSIETTSIENPDRAPKLKEIEAAKLELASKKTSLEAIERTIVATQVRIEELRQVYQEARDLQDSIGRLSEALAKDEIEQRRAERTYALLNSAEANPFEITADVVVDPRPTEPNPWLIVSFGLVLGLAVGVGAAVVSEYSKSGFRSVSDVGRLMVVPILGAVQRIQTRRERRAEATRRTLVGLSSVIVVATILFVTWAWAFDAQLLSQDVRDAIETVRSKLK